MDNIKITIEIIVALLALLGAGGGAYTIYKVRNKRITRAKQENITIQGNSNKVIGGDDNSVNI